MYACGLDPSAGRGFNGYAILSMKGDCRTWRLAKTGASRILYKALEELVKCSIIGIDAPLTLPYRGFRLVERRMIKDLGARLLPGGLEGMRKLTLIGYSLRKMLEESGIAFIETHPGTLAKINNIRLRDDIVDAIMAGAVAASHLCGLSEYYIDYDGVIAVARFTISDGIIQIRY